jgi:hypothetical protein
MMEFTIVDSLTGKIIRSGKCQDNDVDIQAGIDELCIIGTHNITSYYDGINFTEIPPQPTPNHTFNYATKHWEPDAALAAQLATSKRAQLLQSSDWTQLPDVPLATKEAWAVYRQTLRDITLQAGYPLAIDWPLAP